MGAAPSIFIIDSSKNEISSLSVNIKEVLPKVRIHSGTSDIHVRQYLTEHEVDLIIADVHSLSVSAITFQQMLENEFPGVALILTSSSYSAETGIEMLELGAFDFIRKQCHECIAQSTYRYFTFDKPGRTKLSNELSQVVDLIQKSNIGELYITTLDSYRFIYANNTLMNNLGYEVSEFKGMFMADVIENFKVENLRNRLSALDVNTDDIVSMSLNHIRKNGSIYPVETHFKVYRQQHKNYLIGLCINKSSQKSDQDALNKLRKQEKYRSDFIANISHEMRTTLNSVFILSKTLAENKQSQLSDSDNQSLKAIHSATGNLLQLLNQVLDLKKIDAGKTEIRVADISVQNLIQQLHTLHQPIAQNKGISFSYTLSEKFPEQFRTDPVRLLQILNNLVSNAIKFTRKGGIRIHADYHPEKDKSGKKCITIHVSDTGIGIPEEKQALIFESFQQADGADTETEFGGTGLGLSISKKLADLLNGTLTVQSIQGEGTTFSITLHELNANIQRETPVEEESEIANTTGSVNDVEVLLVDDNTTHNLALHEFLKFHVKNCISTESAAEAYTVLKDHDIDVIILDMYLPDSNGEQVLAYLQEQPTLRDIPVIIYTGKNLQTSELAKLKERAAAVVEKNVNSYRVLVQTLHRLFDK